MSFVLTPAIGLLACVAVHVLVSRAAPAFPRLHGVIVSVVAGFAAVVALVLLYARRAAGSPLEDSGTAVAWAVAYLALAYTYVFGFFNLSESARRVRLLVELRAAGARGLALEEILAAYNARMIVEARLGRMLAGAQITERDGRYVIRQSLMLTVAKILVMGKLVLLGAASEFDGTRGPRR